MKKLIVSLFAVLFVLGMTGISQAYYEEYTGYQSVGEGNSYNFGFDLWFAGSTGTDSSLKLTTDAVGAFGSYSDGFVRVGFNSADLASETATVKLDAWGDSGGYFNLGTYSFNAWLFDPDKTIDIALSPEMLAALSLEGWGSVKVIATLDGAWLNYNDFGLTKVGLGVAVPEPTSLLLLGLGLLGIAGWRRK